MLRIDIDAADIARQFKEMALEVEQDIKQGVAKLAAAMHAKVLEDSQQELHTSRKAYADALNRLEEVSDGVYVIALDQSALWIEEGIPSNHDMKPDLLKNVAPNRWGMKSKVIPFEHAKPSSQMTGLAKKISGQLGRELKKRGVPFKKGVEYDSNGSPRVGKIHEFDFASAIPGKGNTPALKNVNIYQSMIGGNVRRQATTFRTVTDSPGSAGKWIHPGLMPRQFFEAAQEWGMQEWDSVMLPEILKKWNR